MARRSTPRRTKAQWSALLEEQANSSETIAQFCERRRIAISNFYAWKAKLKKQTPENSTSDYHSIQDDSWISLPAIQTAKQQSQWDIELALPGGVVLRMREG